MKNLRTYIFFGAGLLLLAISSCKTARQATTVLPDVPQWIEDLSAPKLIKDKELYLNAAETIPVDSAIIRRDTLHLYTGALQACEAKNFHLLWNGSFTKSIPPQAPLKLLLTSAPDCRETHHFHLTYNLRPLQAKPHAAPADSILLHLFGTSANQRYRISQ